MLGLGKIGFGVDGVRRECSGHWTILMSTDTEDRDGVGFTSIFIVYWCLPAMRACSVVEQSGGNGQVSDVTGSAGVIGRYLAKAIISDKSK